MFRNLERKEDEDPGRRGPSDATLAKIVEGRCPRLWSHLQFDGRQPSRIFGIDTAIWTKAARGRKGVPWFMGVAVGVARLMTT